MGVGGSEAHHHGAKILKAGFSKAKCNDVCAMEVPPHPKDKEAVQSNTELVALSSGTIPPLAQLRLLSVGGGHTNTFLRACKAGCTTPVASLASVGGRLNAASLAAGNAAFQEAISDGLNWLVVDWRHNCSCFDVIGASRWYIDRTAPQHVAFCCYFWFLVSLRN